MRKLLFDKYVNGELELTPILNILMNDPHHQFGKYFLEEYGRRKSKTSKTI